MQVGGGAAPAPAPAGEVVSQADSALDDLLSQLNTLAS
jgi:hypothetical protein